MWDRDGLELTGVYGTWAERSYELVDAEPEVLTLLMSAEEAPGPDWVQPVADMFYGQSTRWALRVPRSEVTDIHSTLVQGTIDGHFVDVLAQPHDGAWAVAVENPTEIFAELELLHRLGVVPVDGVWSGWVPAATVSITEGVSLSV